MDSSTNYLISYHRVFELKKCYIYVSNTLVSASADATTTAVPPLAPLIAPLPARPAGDGTEEEGDGYATVMEGREEEDNGEQWLFLFRQL